MASLKDAQRVVQEGKTAGSGQLVQLPENQKKEGLGFAAHKAKGISPTEGTFRSAGFINAPSEINVIVQDQRQEEIPAFVTPRGSLLQLDCCRHSFCDSVV